MLDREEYIEQAYFFRTVCQRMQQGMSTQELLAATGSWYGGHPVELCAPGGSVDRDAAHFSRSKRMLETYEAYGTGDPSFDRRNLDRFAGDVHCPPLDEATLHRYLAFAEADGWGHRSAS